MFGTLRRALLAHLIIILFTAVVVALLWDALGPAALLLLLAVATVTYVWIVRRFVVPIEQLTQTINRLVAGDRQARILSIAGDEVGQLIRAFNDLNDYYLKLLSKLQKSRARFASVFKQTLDGMIITKGSGRVVSINPAAVRMLNLRDAKPHHRTLAEVVRHHEIIDLWRRSAQSRETESSIIEIGSGGQVWQVEVSPFDQGHVRGQLVILHDLTPVRRLETVRRDFVSNISHELRTPLASLRAVIETLQDGALDDPPAAQRFLSRAEIEIDTLTQMVEELLELSRIESGKVPFQMQPTAIGRILLQVADRLRPQAERGAVTLVTRIPDDLPSVLADANRIQQVALNLLHNAIKFTPHGGEVVLSAETITEPGPRRSDGRRVRIAVADTGVGIAADDLPRIFERFYKADRARTRGHGGTGLGLAIAKHIVQSHDGDIWAESRLGKGSTFYFTLPIA